MLAFRDSRGSVEIAFTDRLGGVSTGPFAELNLTMQDGESPAAVRRNTGRVAEAMAGPHAAVPDVLTLHQVHGNEVVEVGNPMAEPTEATEPTADAVVTRTPGRLLAARAADCVPVLLADPDRGVVGAAHAGRAGVAADVVGRAVAALRRMGARDLLAWLGPRACGRCYEVPALLRDEVAAVVPETWGETSWGTPALDLGAGLRAQLERDGAEVVDVARCTIEDASFFSYRRQGSPCGRHAGLVWLRS